MSHAPDTKTFINQQKHTLQVFSGCRFTCTTLFFTPAAAVILLGAALAIALTSMEYLSLQQQTGRRLRGNSL
jgi:hypothetical protein